MRNALLLFATLLVGAAPLSDNRHDFDFELGAWTMSPSGNTHLVERLWNGGTIARLIVPQPAPHVRGSLLTIYRPDAREWRVYWADAISGILESPLVGRFSHGTGTFVGRSQTAAGPILVRLRYFNITPRSFQSEQSTSRNGGASWQHGIVQTYTRLRGMRTTHSEQP